MHDIHDLFTQGIEAFKKGDVTELKTISDQVILAASLIEDAFTFDLAVVLYACAKLLQRHKCDIKDCREIIYGLEEAHEEYTKEDVQAAEQTLHTVSKHIKQTDESFHVYVQDVLERARLKKSATLYDHGISLAQSASELGVSQWELANYVGKKSVDKFESQSVRNMRKRLSVARSLFIR